MGHIKKTIGHFRELPYGDKNGPSIVEEKGHLSEVSVDSVVRYLENGKIYAISAGISFDYFDKKTVIGPLSSMTDGEWSWMSDLIYYVKTYRVGLPNEFLSFVEDRLSNRGDEIAKRDPPPV